MRQQHRAGEKLFIDYAGPTLPIINAATGEITPAHIFVAALGASNYTYACATSGETQVDWLTSLGQALSYFGGVPEMVVPDNPRALIAHPDRYEPGLNRAALECVLSHLPSCDCRQYWHKSIATLAPSPNNESYSPVKSTLLNS